MTSSESVPNTHSYKPEPPRFDPAAAGRRIRREIRDVIAGVCLIAAGLFLVAVVIANWTV